MATAATEFAIVVRNGRVIGMGGDCIDLEGNSSKVEDVTSFYCGGSAISVGFSGHVARSYAGNSLYFGIVGGEGASAEGNEARANGGYGIYLNTPALGGSVIGNRSLQNGTFGIAIAGSGALVSKNVLGGNVAGFMTGEARTLGDNLCNGSLC